MQKICITLANGKKMNFNLYEEYAPITVANFMHLIDTGVLRGTIFHRVIGGFMSQGGGYTIVDNIINQVPVPYTIPGEFEANGFINPIVHELGTISMARTANPNSAYNQFFICDEKASFLNNQYAAFGKIADEESLAVARELNAVNTSKVANFEDFPVTALVDITISDVIRV